MGYSERLTTPNIISEDRPIDQGSLYFMHAAHPNGGGERDYAAELSLDIVMRFSSTGIHGDGR